MGKQIFRALSALAFLASTTSAAQDAAGVEWLSDLNQATELAAETGRPLLIVFR